MLERARLDANLSPVGSEFGQEVRKGDGAMDLPDENSPHELVVQLSNLVETALRLAPGPDRMAALEQIKEFQYRLAVLLARPGQVDLGKD